MFHQLIGVLSIMGTFLCSIATNLSAQPWSRAFLKLATTEDGSQLYFISPLRPSGSNVDAGPNVLRFTPSGFQFVGQKVVPDGYTLSNLDISGDASVIVYSGYYTNLTVNPHRLKIETISVIMAPGKEPITYAGRAQLSRNGGYVLLAPSDPQVFDSYVVVNLETGDQTFFPLTYGSLGSRQTLTSDGRIVLCSGISSGFPVVVWSSKGRQTIPVNGLATNAIINDQGTTVVYEDTYEADQTDGKLLVLDLRAVDLASGRDIVIDSVEARPAANGVSGFPARISDDGTIVLYSRIDSSGYQLYVASTAGGLPQPLISLSNLVETAMSGDGKTVYAATNNRLLQIDVATGTVQELVKRAPSAQVLFAALAPGSVYTAIGYDLTDHAETAVVDGVNPLPDILGNVQVRVAGTSAKLLEVTPTSIRFQVPFEASVGESRLDISTGNTLEPGRQPFFIRALAPSFLQAGSDAVAWHTDFGSLAACGESLPGAGRDCRHKVLCIWSNLPYNGASLPEGLEL